MPGSIVVGYDASPGARAALDQALELAAALGDRLIIGFGVAPPAPVGEEVRAHRQALRDHAEKMTAEALERCLLKTTTSPRDSTSSRMPG
jgi:nucleotide-binding universal stress UspA family protein